MSSILVMVFVFACFIYSDNPVTIEGLTEECFHASTNSQFQYETLPELHTQLQAEFGKVRIITSYIESIKIVFS